MIIADSCSVILLAKATLLERAIETYNINITKIVLEEIMKGKENMSTDALIVEKLKENNKLNIIDDDKKITQRLELDFNMGLGEASTISMAITEKCIIATDNKQGRKAAFINNLNLVGSPDIVVSLWKKEKISKEKAIDSLETLRKEGWFDNYIIEKAMDDIR